MAFSAHSAGEISRYSFSSVFLQYHSLFVTLQTLMIHPRILYRLTALWGFSEAILGGIMHALRFPFTGIIVGGFAALVICLLGMYSDSPKRILQATFNVLLIKFLLAPHTPAAAYLAVSVQGVAGFLFFLSKRNITVSCYAMGIFALVYSAFIKLISTTIIFGMEFWTALDTYFNYITKQFRGTDSDITYSLYLVIGYVSLYVVAGIFFGFIATRLPHWIEESSGMETALFEFGSQPLPSDPDQLKSRKLFTIPKAVISITALGLLIATYTMPEQKSSLVPMLIRAGIVIVLWITIINPIISFVIARIMKKKASERKVYLASLIELFPKFKRNLSFAWQALKTGSPSQRVKGFFSRVFYLALYVE